MPIFLQHNRTYLHWAAQGNSETMVKKLISLNADCTARTNVYPHFPVSNSFEHLLNARPLLCETDGGAGVTHCGAVWEH